jgi:hypothetical protein
MMPDQVRKWLKQHSKDFHTVGFHVLVRRLDKCINVREGYVEKDVIFSRFHYVVYPFVTYLLTPLCTIWIFGSRKRRWTGQQMCLGECFPRSAILVLGSFVNGGGGGGRAKKKKTKPRFKKKKKKKK